MALRDYYRCKKCDAKVAYGPDRPECDWEPHLLCRECIIALQERNRKLVEALSNELSKMVCVCKMLPYIGEEPPCGTCRIKAALLEDDHARG